VGYGRSKRRTLFLGQVRRIPAYLCLEAATARKRQKSNVFKLINCGEGRPIRNQSLRTPGMCRRESHLRWARLLMIHLILSLPLRGTGHSQKSRACWMFYYEFLHLATRIDWMHIKRKKKNTFEKQKRAPTFS